MQSIKFRYVFKRKSDGHIYMLIVPIEVLEDAHGEVFSMLANDLWELVSRDRFIGFLDKNECEVYENDILESKCANGVVCWSEKYVGFWIKEHDGRAWSNLFKEDKIEYEKVGNTHEHEFVVEGK